MKTQAALWTVDQPLQIKTVEILPPKEDEVLVEIKATGVCHSDLKGVRDSGMKSPTILGHEGAGVVIETGRLVRHVKPGDPIVLSWLPCCGRCYFCEAKQPQLCQTAMGPLFEGTLMDGTTRFRYEGMPVHHFSLLSTFAHHTVVPARSCIKMNSDMPFAQASLIGCGVATGYGAVVHAAKVLPGSTVAIIGLGGVGSAAIQGALACKAKSIIAIDQKSVNLDFAQELGATYTIASKNPKEVSALIEELTDGIGVDVAIDATGSTQACQMAWDLTRRGGIVVVVGAFADSDLQLPAQGFHRTGKTLKASFYGDIHPIDGLRELTDAYLAGDLQLDRLVRKRIRLESINDVLNSFEDPSAANVGRAVIEF